MAGRAGPPVTVDNTLSQVAWARVRQLAIAPRDAAPSTAFNDTELDGFLAAFIEGGDILLPLPTSSSGKRDPFGELILSSADDIKNHSNSTSIPREYRSAIIQRFISDVQVKLQQWAEFGVFQTFGKVEHAADSTLVSDYVFNQYLSRVPEPKGIDNIRSSLETLNEHGWFNASGRDMVLAAVRSSMANLGGIRNAPFWSVFGDDSPDHVIAFLLDWYLRGQSYKEVGLSYADRRNVETGVSTFHQHLFALHSLRQMSFTPTADQLETQRYELGVYWGALVRNFIRAKVVFHNNNGSLDHVGLTEFVMSLRILRRSEEFSFGFDEIQQKILSRAEDAQGEFDKLAKRLILRTNLPSRTRDDAYRYIGQKIVPVLQPIRAIVPKGVVANHVRVFASGDGWLNRRCADLFYKFREFPGMNTPTAPWISVVEKIPGAKIILGGGDLTGGKPEG